MLVLLTFGLRLGGEFGFAILATLFGLRYIILATLFAKEDLDAGYTPQTT